MRKRRASSYVELNADGTVKVYFSDEEAFKRSLGIAQKSRLDESRALLANK